MREYLRTIGVSLWSVAVALRYTLPHLFRPAVTIQYPDEKEILPERARAQLHCNIDDCIGCEFCARSCPVDCIIIETAKAGSDEDLGRTTSGNPKRLHVLRFDIDMSKCCYCELCVHPCPTECLYMTPKYENGVYNRDNLIYHYSIFTPEEAILKGKEVEERTARETAERASRRGGRAARAAATKEAVAREEEKAEEA